VIELAPGDADYPARLRDLASAPDPLWIDGELDVFRARAVAVVGTRRMTGYGERVAREIAAACARAGVVVVSGLAQGIDSAAHRGALDAGGRTIAVLGEGITLFVASVHGRRRPLVPRIRASGALVSQYAPTFCAQPWTFAKRNATMAALADAVVIVEARAVSGALITAADARGLGRTVFAVPSAFGSGASAGTDALIADGLAIPLTTSGDLLRALGRGSRGSEVKDDPILDVLVIGPAGLDEIASRARLSSDRVASRLAALVLRGAVETLSDGRYRRV
jgi:DNA processing protein